MLNQLAVALGDQGIVLEPDDVATIGRAEDNRLITNDPRVSRAHLQISPTADQWLVQNVGRAGTFLGDERVVSFVVTHDVSLKLGSPDGPELRIELLHGDDEEEAGRDQGETILTWPSVPRTGNEETGAPIAAITRAPTANPVSSTDQERLTDPVTLGATEPVEASHGGSRPDTATRSRSNTARKTSTGATLVVLVLVYLVIAGASHLWPFQTSGQGHVSGQGSEKSVKTLVALMPDDVKNCERTPGPSGRGLVVSVTCTPAGMSGSVTGVLFDNASDEKLGFATFNNQEKVDVRKLGDTCPPANGSRGGFTGWHNTGQRPNPDQVLECYEAGSGAPVYVWTIPSGHAFVIAVGSKSESFQTVEQWWAHNA